MVTFGYIARSTPTTSDCTCASESASTRSEKSPYQHDEAKARVSEGWPLGIEWEFSFTVTVTKVIPEPGKNPSRSRPCHTGYLPRSLSVYKANL